ncbi:transcription termination factor MTERF15, mitochondrial-like [Diospyros lotus]|uniref:transcription termination factor MTERF15, mitochondrial-like n=1 Tax=Diospyros lotus TaxID=55363 RepID=UPI00224F9753|nr:transcription termination factor MTERF15, mitochondrial-like [Diospyros lotus]XP_052204832.1 transcription termination factor MTERF15, mitochondrial-like [Diospyros lotus]
MVHTKLLQFPPRMAAFFCRKWPLSNGIIGSSWRRIIELQRVPFAPPIGKFFSSDRLASKDEEQELVIATIAAASSKKVAGNAELVKIILRDYGFTDARISKMAAVRPSILSCNPDKILLPKLEFFRSIGLSSTDLPRIIWASKGLLFRSLEKQLIPCYNFLKSVLLLDENVLKMLKRGPGILLHDVDKTIAPNLAALREAGAPQSIIFFMLIRSPRAIHQDTQKFKESLNKAVQMGFNPSKSTFACAVQVLCEMPESTWDHKMEVYGRCGMSRDEVLLAFRSHPLCMYLSEEKITRAMDFLVKEMGWKPAAVARCSAVIFFKLEKRIMPRCAVIKVLLERGLVKKDICLSTFLLPSEKSFLDLYVKRYEDDVPGLMGVFMGKRASQTRI